MSEPNGLKARNAVWARFAMWARSAVWARSALWARSAVWARFAVWYADGEYVVAVLCCEVTDIWNKSELNLQPLVRVTRRLFRPSFNLLDGRTISSSSSHHDHHFHHITVSYTFQCNGCGCKQNALLIIIRK